MKKKYLMMMLAVAVSASMMFTGCGNKSEEVAVDAQSTQETQAEVVDTVPETAEPTTEAVVSIPYGEENNWEFCEDMELELPYVVVFTDENGDETEVQGYSLEKLTGVHKITNIEEVASDKEGMKKILIDYVDEVNFNVILNELEYIPGTTANIAWRVAGFIPCDYYSGMQVSFEREAGDNETSAVGQFTWEWNGEVYPISYKCNTVSYSKLNGNAWERYGDNLVACNYTDTCETSIEIETPQEYDGLVLMIPKEGQQEYTKLEDSTTEMKEVLLDADGNMKSQDEFYIYRVCDIQSKVAENKVESSDEAVAGADFLVANNIKIDSLPTLEMFADDAACRSIFQGYMGVEEYDGSFVPQYATIETTVNQTVVKIYHNIGYSSISGKFDEYDYLYIVDFYDRYTGENILKTSDIHGTFAEDSKTLEAKEGFGVDVSFSPYEELVINDRTWYWNIATYTITHADGYDGLVVHVGGYDTPSVKAEHESLNKDTYTLLDRPALLHGMEQDNCKRSYVYTATDN